MEGKKIDSAELGKVFLTLFGETYVGPESAEGTWFVDNEADCGVLGTLEALDAAAASRPLTDGDAATAAAHANHLRFALNLANRAARGENAYAGADWKSSWAPQTVDEASWKSLLADLRAEVEAYREVVSGSDVWTSGVMLTGTFSLIAHGAWHLGALRQGLRRIRID